MCASPLRRLNASIRRRGALNDEERDLLISGVRMYGHQWAKIAQMIEGRTAKEINDAWKTLLVQRWSRKRECLEVEMALDDKENGPPRPLPQKKYRLWTEEEKTALQLGVKEHGAGAWSRIKNAYAFKDALRHRTPMCLKNRWKYQRKEQEVIQSDERSQHRRQQQTAAFALLNLQK